MLPLAEWCTLVVPLCKTSVQWSNDMLLRHGAHQAPWEAAGGASQHHLLPRSLWWGYEASTALMSCSPPWLMISRPHHLLQKCPTSSWTLPCSWARSQPSWLPVLPHILACLHGARLHSSRCISLPSPSHRCWQTPNLACGSLPSRRHAGWCQDSEAWDR